MIFYNFILVTLQMLAITYMYMSFEKSATYFIKFSFLISTKFNESPKHSSVSRGPNQKTNL